MDNEYEWNIFLEENPDFKTTNDEQGTEIVTEARRLGDEIFTQDYVERVESGNLSYREALSLTLEQVRKVHPLKLEKAEPFNIRTIDNSASGVSFDCPDCGEFHHNLYRHYLDKEGYMRLGNKCCRQYKAPTEAIYALDAIAASLCSASTEVEKDKLVEAAVILVIFGVIPLGVGIACNLEGGIAYGGSIFVIAIIFAICRLGARV